MENKILKEKNTLETSKDSTFEHVQHAHCESGVISNLLQHSGIPISEAMAFGIGAGIFFGHFPFIKVNGIPGTTFRIWPGYIFKRVTQRLGIQTHFEKFKNEAKGMDALDKILANGIPVGMLGSVYYLSYLPEAFRFHFNAHNLVAYGKEGNEYHISDPVMETTTLIKKEDLQKSRFAKGFPEPKGKLYYIKDVPKLEDINFAKAIQSGIKQSCFFMLSPILNYAGYRAIHLLANRIKKYPQKLDPRRSQLYLGNIIRMQEEIGTGGAGFRFLYAAFLQEAGDYLNRDDLRDLSKQYTKIGDEWRSFAYNTARGFKSRKTDVVSFTELSDQLHEIANQEQAFFLRLKKLKW